MYHKVRLNNFVKNTFILHRFLAKTVSVLHSIKTALPLTIPGFDNDQSRSVQLVPLPPPSPHSVTFDSSAEFKNIQSLLAEDLDTGPSTVKITYSTERSKLEEMLCNWRYRDCRVEPAFEAMESSLSRNVSFQPNYPDLNNLPSDIYESCTTLDDSKALKGI